MHCRLKPLIAALAAFSMVACTKEAPAPTAKVPQQPAPPPPPLVVTIGHVSALTGASGAIGLSSEQGARLAIEEANAAKPVIKGGQPVRFELVTADDQASPTKAIEVAQAMVARKVNAVIGHLGTEASTVAAKIYADANIAQLSPATGSALTGQGYPTAFRIISSDKQQAAALAKYALDSLHAKKVALLSDDTAYGEGMAAGFKEVITKGGAELILDQRLKFTDMQFGAVLAKVKKTQPDVVFFAGLDYQAAPLASQMSKASLHMPLLTPDGACNADFLHAAGSASEGQLCARNGLPLEKMKGNADFIERYKAKFTAAPQVASAYAYDAVMVVVDAVKRAQSLEPETLRSAIAHAAYRGMTGEIAFEGNGDLKDPGVSLFVAQDGGWDVASFIGGDQPVGDATKTAAVGKAAAGQTPAPPPVLVSASTPSPASKQAADKPVAKEAGEVKKPVQHSAQTQKDGTTKS